MNVSVQSNIIKKMFGVNDMQIDIQLFADVEKGNFSNNRLSDNDDNTQFYGLAGNDTIESGGRNAILIGGSGNDILHICTCSEATARSAAEQATTRSVSIIRPDQRLTH